MANAAFVAPTGGTVALTAATAKTILEVIAATNRPITLTELSVSFDGVSASVAPVLVELFRSTSPGTAGTNSTSVTPVLVRGNNSATAGATAAKSWTTEPTGLTIVREWQVDPNKGLLIVQFPLGREVEPGLADAARGIGIRCTSPATINARAYLEWEE